MSQDETPAPTALHAWIDERMHVDLHADRGTFILAAVVGDPAGCEPMRDLLRGLLRGRNQRLHWREENTAGRTAIASALGSTELGAVVAVGTPMRNRRQERARRMCMEALLPALEGFGIARVIVEARTPSLTRKDRAHVAAMANRKLISRALRVEIALPVEEPMLWAPDAIAGAVGAARLGEPRWLDLLRPLVTEIEVSIR